jgi:hypothetical protein
MKEEATTRTPINPPALDSTAPPPSENDDPNCPTNTTSVPADTTSTFNKEGKSQQPRSVVGNVSMYTVRRNMCMHANRRRSERTGQRAKYEA